VRILIADDNLKKVGALIQLLTELGVPREAIDAEPTAMQARERLRANQYDLFVLDLMIPLREETEPKVQVAAELLRDISDRDTYFKPTQIVGFTAYDEAFEAANVIFNEMLWVVIFYDPSSEEWKGSFRNAVSYLKARAVKSPPVTYATDVCLITALRSPEMDAVHRLPWAWEEPVPLDDATFVRCGTGGTGSGTFSVVTAAAPRMGSVAAALLAAKMIQQYRPRYLVMGGICAGLRGKVDIGDVVLFDPTWEWPSGKITSREGREHLEPAPHQLSSSEFVNSHVVEMSRDHLLLSGIRARWHAPPPANALRVVVAPAASGSAVVASLGAISAIREQHRKLGALDMEAYGVCAAAKAASIPRPTAIILKSVCDFADETKSDGWQAYASFASAEVIKELFERNIVAFRSMAGT
jgi:nucleoside phosphorylase/CheY-like chemotaxis protein